MDVKRQKAWETALERADVATCRTLIEQGADMHAPVLIAPTALHFAAMMHCGPLVELFIQAGAQVDHPGGSANRTALACVTVKGDRRIAAQLISAGADLSYVPPNPDPGYLTPFQTLVRDRKLDEVRYYAVTYGVDLAQRTVAGRTLIQLCAGDEAAKALIRSLKSEVGIRGALPDLVGAPGVVRGRSELGCL